MIKCFIILAVNWIFHYSDNVQNFHALLHFPENKAIRINLNPRTKLVFFFLVFFLRFVFLFFFIQGFFFFFFAFKTFGLFPDNLHM